MVTLVGGRLQKKKEVVLHLKDDSHVISGVKRETTEHIINNLNVICEKNTCGICHDGCCSAGNLRLVDGNLVVVEDCTDMPVIYNECVIPRSEIEVDIVGVADGRRRV